MFKSFRPLAVLLFLPCLTAAPAWAAAKIHLCLGEGRRQRHLRVARNALPLVPIRDRPNDAGGEVKALDHYGGMVANSISITEDGQEHE